MAPKKGRSNSGKDGKKASIISINNSIAGTIIIYIYIYIK